MSYSCKNNNGFKVIGEYSFHYIETISLKHGVDFSLLESTLLIKEEKFLPYKEILKHSDEFFKKLQFFQHDYLKNGNCNSGYILLFFNTEEVVSNTKYMGFIESKCKKFINKDLINLFEFYKSHYYTGKNEADTFNVIYKISHKYNLNYFKFLILHTYFDTLHKKEKFIFSKLFLKYTHLSNYDLTVEHFYFLNEYFIDFTLDSLFKDLDVLKSYLILTSEKYVPYAYFKYHYSNFKLHSFITNKTNYINNKYGKKYLTIINDLKSELPCINTSLWHQIRDRIQNNIIMNVLKNKISNLNIISDIIKSNTTPTFDLKILRELLKYNYIKKCSIEKEYEIRDRLIKEEYKIP